ncbi:MAG: hypothetical protein JSU08_13095 [Acidobacteria bacterium]|nr:hypothetical protein [Acidobacteriota bacterium]
MGRWLTLAAVLAIPVVMSPPDLDAQARVTNVREELVLDENGSADVRVTFAVPANVEAVRVPVIGGAPQNVSVADSQDPDTRATWDSTRRQIAVAMPAAAAGRTIVVRYTLANAARRQGAGALTLRREFVNTTDAAFERYVTSVVLPDRYVFNAVTTTDGDGKNEKERITLEQERHTVVLDTHLIANGGRAVLDVRASRRSFSWPVAALLALVSIGYLYRFRDLAGSRRDEP